MVGLVLNFYSVYPIGYISQLICARGFLNSIENDKEIEINLDMIPNNIKNGLISIAAKRKEAEEISYIIPSTLIISPNIYKGFLKEDEYINKFITTDINIHIRCFYDKFKTDIKNREKILKIVDHSILQFAEDIQNLVEKMLNRKFNDRFLYALSLHLGAFFNRVDSKEVIEKVIKASSIFKKELNIGLTMDEIYFIVEIFN